MGFWKFRLARSSDMSVLANISHATSKSLDLVLDRSGSGSFTLALEDEKSALVQKHSTCLIAYRKDDPIWSGPVWQRQASAASGKLVVTCVGWFEELGPRVIRPGEQVTYTAQDAGLIAHNLLGIANAQQDGGSVVRPTRIVTGSRDVSQNRTRAYAIDQQIGPAILELSNIEAGFDFSVHPLRRTLDIHYQTVAGTIFGLGVDRPEVVFGYGLPPHNLADAGFQEDGGRTANRINAIGAGGVRGFAEDTAAMDDLGMMYEVVESVGTAPLAIAGAYANVELLFRAKGETIYSLLPMPWAPNSGVPEPFVDYGLGDIVRFRVKKGSFTIPKQSVRVFGMKVSIDDETGAEKITGLDTAPQS